jgi:predicted O-methyltransferase YrrM
MQERNFDAVWPTISSIQGWLAREEAAALHDEAAAVRSGRCIVEIGSHHGRSTAALATGKPNDVRLVAIDPYPGPRGEDNLRAFCRTMQRIGAGPEVRLFWGTSEEAASSRNLLFAGDEVSDATQPEIGLLFIDGLHDRNSVLLDIDLWEAFVGHGGAVMFHDAFFRTGTTLAVLQRYLLNSWFRYERSVCNMSIFRRVDAMGDRALFNDAVRLTARLGHFGHNALITVGVRTNWRWLQRVAPPSPDFEY